MLSESEQAFVREVWGLQGAAYLVVALRYYSRFSIMGWRGLVWDDAIMFVAVIVHTLESLMAYLVVSRWRGLANNAMTDTQRAMLDPKSEEWHLRVNGSKTHIAGLILYATLLWMLKASWLVYYARLTEGLNNMKRLIHWGAAIVGATYVSCLLVAFLKCIPFHHQWQIYPSPGNHCMPAISTVQTIYVMVMNTLTDFYLMAIPLPVVWKSYLPLRKKLVLLVMFSGGLLEMAFGILRCVSILTLGDIDPAQSGYWSVRESFVSVVLTNIPMVYPIVRRFIDRGFRKNRSESTIPEDLKGYKLGSLPPRRELEGRPQRPSFRTQNNTQWSSQERITTGKEASDCEESSANLPKHQAIVVSLNAGDVPRKSSRLTNSDDQIVVTREYIVVGGR